MARADESASHAVAPAGAGVRGRFPALAAAGICWVLCGGQAASGTELEYQAERVRWLGSMRSCASYRGAAVSGPAPLVVVLGRAGRSARYALDSWREVADEEGLVVAAVPSADAASWRLTHDGPAFLRAVVQQLMRRHAIDSRRLYLFGYDSGGGFALSMGLLESRYFAAVAAYGAVLPPGSHRVLGQADRPIPIALYLGSRDRQVGLAQAQETLDYLVEAGAAAELVEVKGMGSDFERRGRKVVGRIWGALSAHALSEDPRFESYPFDG